MGRVKIRERTTRQRTHCDRLPEVPEEAREVKARRPAPKPARVFLVGRPHLQQHLQKESFSSRESLAYEHADANVAGQHRHARHGKAPASYRSASEATGSQRPRDSLFQNPVTDKSQEPSCPVFIHANSF